MRSDREKTYLCSSCCFPLVEGSREKGAYLDEIKRKMRGSGLGLAKGDDHGQKRQGRGGDREAGSRCLGWLDMGGILIWV